MGSPLNVGVVGVGVISRQYFEHLPKLPNLRLTAVADLDLNRASAVAAEQGVEALSVDDLLADPRVNAVLNLTIPAAHAEVALRSVRAWYTDIMFKRLTKKRHQVLHNHAAPIANATSSTLRASS